MHYPKLYYDNKIDIDLQKNVFAVINCGVLYGSANETSHQITAARKYGFSWRLNTKVLAIFAREIYNFIGRTKYTHFVNRISIEPMNKWNGIFFHARKEID